MIGNTPWPNLLADLEAKRDAIAQIIETVKTHFVGSNGHEMPDSPIAAPAPGPRPRRKYTRRAATNTNGRKAANRKPTDRPTEQSPRHRSLPDDGALSSRVLMLLKTPGPISPVTLAEKLGVHKQKIRTVLKVMAKGRDVVLEGKTISRRVRLPEQASAKEDD